MNLTHKNQGFYYNSGGRIKSWSFRSASNVIIHILKNQVNSYDSNGVIAVPISTLGDEKWNLPFFLFTYSSLESPEHIGSYYTLLTEDLGFRQFLLRVTLMKIDFWSEVLPQCILQLFSKKTFSPSGHRLGGFLSYLSLTSTSTTPSALVDS